MRELTRVNTLVEANDLKIFLDSNGIDCEIPDQYSLGMGTISNFALGRGRILVAEEDYDQALSLLKEWESPNVPRRPRGISKTLEYPWTVGVSPQQISDGFKNWKTLSFFRRIKIVGGIGIYLCFLMAAGIYIYSLLK